MLNTLHLGKATCTVTGYRVTNMVLPDLRLFLQYEDTLNKEQERGDTLCRALSTQLLRSSLSNQWLLEPIHSTPHIGTGTHLFTELSANNSTSTVSISLLMLS